MTKSEEIKQAWDAWESQFRAKQIAPGTPFRKQLQAAADAERNRIACLPENIAQRQLWCEIYHRELSRERRAAAAKYYNAQPDNHIKKVIQAELRKHGYKREKTSDSGSCYYEREGNRIRVSTHEVPMTPEREYKRTLGCFTWASRPGIIYHAGMSDFEILDAVAAAVSDDGETFDDFCESVA